MRKARVTPKAAPTGDFERLRVQAMALDQEIVRLVLKRTTIKIVKSGWGRADRLFGPDLGEALAEWVCRWIEVRDRHVPELVVILAKMCEQRAPGVRKSDRAWLASALKDLAPKAVA